MVDDPWRQILGALESPSQPRDALYKIVQLDEQEILLIPIGATFAFRRMEITGEILHISPRGVRCLEHATELLQMLCRHLATAETGIVWKHFAKELQNGSANLALSYTYWTRKRDVLRRLAAAAEERTTISLIEKCQRLNSAVDPAVFFEQMIVEGHHLHPSAKTKLGMTPDAVYHYSSEFDGAPVVRLVGVRRDHAEWRLLDERADPNELIFEVFPEVRNNVTSEFAGRGLHLTDYVLVPVHPWQLEPRPFPAWRHRHFEP